MAVSLGRTISNPAFLFFQIVHGVSLFLLLLGVSRVVLGVAEVYMRAGTAASAPSAVFARTHAGLGQLAQQHSRSVAFTRQDTQRTPTPASATASPSFLLQLSYCFHVPLASLFDSPVEVDAGAGASPGAALVAAAAAAAAGAPPTLSARPMAAALAEGAAQAVTAASVSTTVRDGSVHRFYFQHILAALLCAYPLAALLQRRKFVLDFVLTIYAAYFVFANVMLRRVWGGGPHWWGACVLGVLLMYGATYALCRRKELQEVRLTGAAGAAASGAAAVPSTVVWVAEDNGAAGEEMRVMPREVPPREAAARARTPFPAANGKGPRSVAEEFSEGSEDAPKHKSV